MTFREVLSIGKYRQYVRPQVDREDLAFLQYTGGTTGVAKGAMLTHGNIITKYFPSEVDCGAIYWRSYQATHCRTGFTALSCFCLNGKLFTLLRAWRYRALNYEPT